MPDQPKRTPPDDSFLRTEERFRLVADAAPIMIWMSGTDMRRTYFNKKWLDFTGRTLQEELQHRLEEGLHPEDRKEVLNAYIAAFEARQEMSMQFRMLRGDGQYRWVYATGIPRHDSHGIFSGYI